MVIPSKNFRTEGQNWITDVSLNHLETSFRGHPNYLESDVDYLDRGCQWFRSFFVGKEYRLYCGVIDGERVIATVVKEAGMSVEGSETDSHLSGKFATEAQYRVIMRSKKVCRERRFF